MNKENRDIVVIGSSAGGVHALEQLVGSLDEDLPASIFIVQHMATGKTSHLPQILSRHGPLKAVHPQDGDELDQGVIYVAPPDHHMILEGDRILVKRGPKENNFRPSIDALMRSAAYWYGPRVVGVVLTGYLNDGTSGLWSVNRYGGVTLVQSPQEAPYPDMPRNVLEHVEVDHVLPLAGIGPLINKLTRQPADRSSPEDELLRERMKAEMEIAAQKNALTEGINRMGEMTQLTCPECAGVLTSFKEGDTLRYRCHTGHGFSWGALWAGIAETVENKLWQAMRSLEEGILFLEQSATHCEMAGQEAEAKALYLKANALREKSKALLDYIYAQGQISDLKL